MAKRKRLSPAKPEFLTAAAPETKSGLPAPRAPITDVASDASAAAALSEMASMMETARQSGRMVIEAPLEQIDLTYLTRDRRTIDEGDMQALIQSIRLRGQQTPIEVTELGAGKYGLISGWRRCQALQHLHGDTGLARYASALALIRLPRDRPAAYVAMVEENEIRVGLSYYERARIAVKAVDAGVFSDEKQALLQLFYTASRAKRSKIRSFLGLVRGLDEALKYPESIGERMGLRLAKMFETNPDAAQRLAQLLRKGRVNSAEDEQALLAGFMMGKTKPAKAQNPKIPYTDRALRGGVVARLHHDGRIELRGAVLSPDLRTQLLAWLDRSLS